MGRHQSILKRNFPWLVSGIPSLPEIVCSYLSYHMRNHLEPKHFSFRPAKCGMLFRWGMLLRFRFPIHSESVMSDGLTEIWYSRLSLFTWVCCALTYFPVSILDHGLWGCCGNKYTSPGNLPVCIIPGDRAWLLPVFYYFNKIIMLCFTYGLLNKTNQI